jgi:sugar lactone lactonase YvrE
MKKFLLSNHAINASAALLLGVLACDAYAQQTMVPSPSVTTIAGQAPGIPGYGVVNPVSQCSTAIKDIGGNSFGNNCSPLQAILANLYDVKVDTEGNIYISEANTTLPASEGGGSSGNDIRVIYKGGTVMTQLLEAANQGVPGFPATPVPGNIYTLAGGVNNLLSAVKNVYYCGGIVGGLVAFDNLGNGCPAALSRAVPRAMALDQYGNVYFVNRSTDYGVRVIYAGGQQVANLIEELNPNVVTAQNPPQVGYVYRLGFGGATGAEGDFGTPINPNGLATYAGMIYPQYGLAVDSSGNVYVSDGINGTAVNGVTTVDDSAENVRMINGTTGVVTTFAGETLCGDEPLNTTWYPYNANNGCPLANSITAANGDNGPAVGSLFNYPTQIFLDQYNNVFIGEGTNARLRVVYRGGTLAGIPNPVVGNIYTYAGGSSLSGTYVQGTLQVSGTPAQQIKFSGVNGSGIDKNGNIYIYDSGTRYLWKIDSTTGIGNIIAGGPTATSAATAGKYCNGGTSGPVSVDAYGDGCPGTQAFIKAIGYYAFDPQGNFYAVNTQVAAQAIVQEYSYQNNFPSTPIGTPVSQYLAFNANSATTLTGRSFSLQGGADAEFSDAGGTTCTPGSTTAVNTECVVKVTFNPSHAGQRPGQITLTSATGVAVTEAMAGTGIAANEAIDPGTVSTLGTGLSPVGVAADFQGSVYVADAKNNQVLKGSATGTTLTPLVTGLNNPHQVAVDNAGNLYIADTGNSRVLITNNAGTKIASIGAGVLSKPQGVAVDKLGNVFVADTGNNRIVTVTAEGYILPYSLTAAGNAAPFTLNAPTQLQFDLAGNLYVLNSGSSPAQIVENLQSTGQTSPVILDPTASPAAFAIDAAGDIYIADMTSGNILDYYAGKTPGFPLLGQFNSSGQYLQIPMGIALDADANIFIADAGLTGALEIRRTLGNTTFPTTAPASTTQASLTVNNVGNSAMNFTAPLSSVSNAQFSLASSTSNGCAAGTAYAAGQSCNFNASFSPLVAANVTGTATFITNAGNAKTAVDSLNGLAAVEPSQSSIALSVVPATGVFYSLPLTVRAIVTCGTGAPTSGTLTLTIDGKTVEPPTGIGTGNVLFVEQEGFGTHQVSVTYSGDTGCSSAAASIPVTVSPAATTTSLTITPTSSSGIASLIFSSTVSVNNNTATGQSGTVTIYYGPVSNNNVVCTGPINSNDNYTLTAAGGNTCNTNTSTPPILNFPNNCFTAVYSGSTDGNFTGSQSAMTCPSTSDFDVAPVVTSFSIPQGSVGVLNLNLTALYGSSGTVTPSCTGLPANSNCRFSLTTIALSSNETAVGVQVQLYTDVPSNLASNERAPNLRGVMLAVGIPLGFGLLLLRRRSHLRWLAALLLAVFMSAGLTGCGSQSTQTFSNLVTPTGTYTLNLVFTGSGGLTAVHTVPCTFTVLPAATVF